MKPTILIIDDSVTVRQQLSAILSLTGYDVIEASDGQLGLAAAIAQPKLSLVLCDVNMPNMNGLEFLEKFRPKERTPPIPVVMLTTDGTPDAIARAKRAGACAWIVKPFQPERLIAAIRRILGETVAQPAGAARG
jgi:two-component system, chemotaxis family, chemotaxis protein CheY